ncbi:MAG TPA: DUF922 domain-containing protein [Puia sp.]|nr:DUF922 domain-containing protein [Puia sp.]
MANTHLPGKSLIDWSPERKLVWSDFRARPVTGTRVAALSGTSIKVDFEFTDESMRYHIRCQFDRERSWGRVKTAYILSHEQLHFDIAELYARKLNKALSMYRHFGRENEKEVDEVYQHVMRVYRDEQEEYDQETDFSIDRAEQARWSKKISAELKALRSFGDYR